MIDRNMLALQLPKLYPITDGAHTLTHAEQVARLCAGGATLIQLRDKHASPREFYAAAEAALRVARTHGARLIINDRADIALALGADGVHLGQADLDPTAARQLLGPQAIIGHSTHNLAQAQTAARSPVDYIAIGGITQANAHAVLRAGADSVAIVSALLNEPELIAARTAEFWQSLERERG